MQEKRREEIVKILEEEREQYIRRLREVQTLFRDLEDMEHDSHISKEVKKYIDKNKLEAGARLYTQLIADVSHMILAVEEGQTSIDYLGRLYDGEMYPELFTIVEKIGFKYQGTIEIFQLIK